MDAEAFFETSEVRTALERAATVAGVPVSLHAFENDHEQYAVTNCGRCADACRYVAGLAWGKQSCRRSREKAGVSSVRRGKPVPFLCHMGFSCVAMAVRPGNGPNHIVTFGPFCPSEAPNSLEDDAIDGLAALTRETVEELPFELDDIQTISARAVPELAEWTTETLAALWDSCAPAAPAESAPEVPADSGAARRQRPAPAVRDPYQAADIAVALSAGNQTLARNLVRGMIADTASKKRISIAVKRARTVAVVSAVLEASERAGLKTQGCWERYPAFERATRNAKDLATLSSNAMGVLGVLKRQATRSDAGDSGFAALSRIVMNRVVDGITLNEVAELLQERPSTITRRLQRNFGMSFTEYTGRIRTDLAKDLLRRTQLKVGEVARRVGVNDIANFGKLFRKYEGMSPTDYRRQFGKKR